MIGIRTPFRVSFAGGSTDIPNFYKKYGGKVVSTSIDKYMYHFIHKFSKKDIQIKYSITELVEHTKDIKHPIVREISKIYNVQGLDINSIADIPKGSGLGSSSAYTVGLVHGLSIFNKENLNKMQLAEIASDIEINRLGDPIGKQDHYASSVGGLNIINFNKDDTVKIKKLRLNEKEIQHLSSSMVLIKYGHSRDATVILSDQAKKIKSQENIDNTKSILDLVDPMVSALTNLDIKSIGELLTENWNYKNKLSKLISNKKLEQTLTEIINKKGIYGGKLLGAGGNGYLLIVGEPKIVQKLVNENSVEFNFEKSGTKKILMDS
tara:strand:- start:2102 stop:3067 length:966 start_codon:yes stop_codon:yes gene_type:complete